ncbi:MAG: T9SS type A sorting domain-containing protein, partial [Bacteroidia bacterium]|nr:T9SS type A sorting domain-containing protein [Bacteroidia bacterium]
VSDNVYVRREAAKVPDLELVSLTTGTNPTAGDVIELEYTIRNNSSTTRASGWNDVAELWDENDQLVKRYHLTHIGRMLKGNTATMKQTLQLPYNFYGDAKIVYMVNDDNDPVEYERNNNSSEVSIQIEAYTPPDLVVRNLQTDKCCKVYALQSDSISIDIRNVGAGDVPGAFVSRVFLSKDQVLDKRDVSLRTFKVKDLDFPKDPTTPNILKYEVQYPNYANGDYYLIAEVDHSDTIYEAAMESNNQYASSYTINLSNEQTNLVLDSFRVSGYTGSDDAFFSVDYFGRKPIDAFLQREFESSVSLLSESGELIKVGSHSFSRTLKQGKDTFQGQLFAFVPGDITPGKYAVVVHLDNKNVVFETNDRDNRKTSAETYLFDFSTELTMDVLANDDFTEQAFNQRKFYRVKRNKDQGMLISLDMEEDRSRTEMYHRVEDIPTSLRYDNKYSSPNLADQNVVVPVIDSNVTDYIQVVANYTPAIVDHFLDPRNRIIDPQPFSILCESKTYSIHQTSPKQASVYGNTSVLVEGFDFRENTQIYLVKGNDTITPFVNEYESSSRISTVFDFRNTTPGMYDVLAETNGNTARLNAYFNVSDTIRETIAAWIESDFTPIELTTNYSTLNVHFGNYGYTDGYDYWLVVGISARRYKTKYLETKYVGSSEEEEIEALIKRLGIEHPNPPLDESYVDIDSIRYYAFWIPKLAAKMNTTFTFKVNSTQPDQIYINSILFPKSLSNFTITGREEDLWTCETLQEINLYAKQQLSKLGKSSGFDCNNIDMNKVHSQIMQETWKVAQSSHPGSKSVSQIAKKGVENWKKNLQDLNPKDQLKSQGKDMVKNLFKEREKSTWEVMKEGATNFFSTYEPNNAVEKVLIPQDIPFSDLTKNVFDCIDFDQVKPKEKCFRAVGVRGSDNQHYVNDCSPSAASNQNSGEKTASWDPNEIIGPEGVTPVRYVDGSDELIYTIYFENLETASAPAITVSVDNPLDTAFRLQEFGIVEIGFGDTSIAFNGENRIDTRIDLGSRYNNAALQIVAGLNTVEHSSFWELTTIDPETGNRLNNPFGGFLPPNDSTGIGEGYVRYRIKLHPHIKGGYKLPNQADIIFDQNKIISTNIWSNIVSDGSPMSWVEELPAISAETFEVNWIGTDGEIGPGINGYEVYVSDNNGPYEKWIPFTTDTTAQFTGESNHEYRFYSIGILNDGQREEVPSTYDAITTVKNSSVESVNDDQGIVVFPNPGNNQIHIVHNGSLEVSLLNLEGKEILRKTGDQHITINTSHLADGMYFVRIHSEKGVTSRRWIKQSF